MNVYDTGKPETKEEHNEEAEGNRCHRGASTAGSCSRHDVEHVGLPPWGCARAQVLNVRQCSYYLHIICMCIWRIWVNPWSKEGEID